MSNTTNELDRKVFSNAITLIRVADGESANSYLITSNYNEVLRFENEQEVVSFSPGELWFQVLDMSTEDNSAISNFKWAISYLKDQEFYLLATNNGTPEGLDGDISGAFTFTKKIPDVVIESDVAVEPTAQNESSLNDRLYFYFSDFYNIIASDRKKETYGYLINEIKNGSAVFKFSYIQNNHTINSKIFSCRNGVTADMAKLNIGASEISAAIRDSSLTFSASGLSIENGDFSIYKNTYIETEVSSDEFINGTYYTLEGSEYLIASSFEAGTKYYVKTPVTILGTEGENLFLKGTIYADSGYFQGEVHATSGEFTGSITATSGTIGGFTIGPYYQPTPTFVDEETYILYEGKYYLATKVDTAYQIEVEGSPIELQSPQNFYKLHDKALYSVGQNLVLLGEAGEMHASNLYLNENIVLNDSILFPGKDDSTIVGLYNPLVNEGKILVANNFSLYDTGKINLGTLEFYGGTGQNDGYIRSTFVDQNDRVNDGFWRINESGSAYFDNITVNDAKIKNSVLEINTIQTVGSLMVFKEGWLGTTEKNSNLLILEGFAVLEPEEWLWDGRNYYEVSICANKEYYECIDEEKKEYRPTTDVVMSELKTYYEITNFNDYMVNVREPNSDELNSYYEQYSLDSGELLYYKTKDKEINRGTTYYVLIFDKDNVKPTTDTSFNTFVALAKPCPDSGKKNFSRFGKSGEYITSILGESRQEGSNAGDFSVGNSLTISSFEIIEGSEQAAYTKHLILGQLSNSNIDALKGASGFGLYSDNVYLNGTLTTFGNEFSAGINTNSSIAFAQGEDNSSIIIWGGARRIESSPSLEYDIENAAFQVTQNGTLYAQKAIINDSVVAGGEIHGAVIYTAELRTQRAQEGVEPVLKIYDPSGTNGIVFLSEDENVGSPKTIFSINNKNFSYAKYNAGQVVYEPFISINEDHTQFTGVFSSDFSFAGGKNIQLSGEGLSFYSVDNQNNKILSGKIGFLLEAETQNKNRLQIQMDKEILASFEQDGIEFYKEMKTGERVYFGEKAKIEVVAEGYDLYIL